MMDDFLNRLTQSHRDTERKRKRHIGIAIILILLLIFYANVPAQADLDHIGDRAWIAPQVQQSMTTARGSGEMVAVIVSLQERAKLDRIVAPDRPTRIKKVIEALQETAVSTQPPIAAFLEQWRLQGKVEAYEPYWVFNGFAVTATADVIENLAAMPQVATITLDESIQAPAAGTAVTASSSSPELNLAVIRAPELWGMGFTGQGIVVANMDSGVDLNHPDLVNRWRGGSNSWFDPYGEHPTTPTDLNGHGTWTMGVLVGGDAGGTAVGTAPGAQWIAVKIFNDQGSGTVSAIHAGFQWLLDPDGNPSTPDTPHVMNNSWTMQNPGCNLEFQSDLQALRAAGILPIFAAGNSGPNGNTSYSPGNYPEGFAVGGTNNSDGLYNSSSRGPSNCGESSTIYPEIMAPGVSIHTTDLFGFYFNATGTSLAAPHVAGGLALLLQAFPGLSVTDQEGALLNGVVDLGAAGADNDFGNGRIDILASFNYIQGSSGTPTPTSPSAATATATTTATATEIPTSTHTATATSETPAVHIDLSFTGSNITVGTLNGVQDEDIVSFNGVNFSMRFDGSAAGLPGNANVDAFQINTDSILLSFDRNTGVDVPGIGLIDDSDIVRYDSNTNTFTLFFTGATADLTNSSEDIDALALLADGRLIISTTGNNVVPGLGTSRDEDLIAFTPAVPGNYNSGGTWSLYFDGSDVDLATSSDEDIDGVSIAAGNIYLTTTGNFSVSGISGNNNDIFVCTAPVTGSSTACSYSSTLMFDGIMHGLFGINVDGIGLSTEVALPTATAVPTGTPTTLPTATPIPTASSTSTPPSPTAPSTPTPSVPTHTPTPTSAAGSIHSGDLDGSSISTGGRWNGSVTITVHDSSENPVSSATVNGTWVYGARSGSGSCVTGGSGSCVITQTNIPNFISTTTFTVDSITHALNYLPQNNHDPEGDSNGTMITVVSP